jgi:hypothetical protein
MCLLPPPPPPSYGYTHTPRHITSCAFSPPLPSIIPPHYYGCRYNRVQRSPRKFHNMRTTTPRFGVRRLEHHETVKRGGGRKNTALLEHDTLWGSVQLSPRSYSSMRSPSPRFDERDGTL